MNDYKIPSMVEIKKLSENDNHKFEVVSLFAGGGGSSCGYRMAGGKVLAINEFIPEAVNTYRANWPTTKIIPDDIRKITGKDILKIINKRPGELDILDGSPPCAGFSVAGKREKNWGQENKYSETRQDNVEDLFFEYIRILREIKPKVFIAENVKGLTIGAAKGYLNIILRELKKSGYQVEARTLNAKWLGVPQNRQRLIIIGIREDLWKAEYKERLHPKPVNKVVILKDAFQGLQLTKKDKIETNIENAFIYPYLKKLKRGAGSDKYFQLWKASPNKPCNCLTATINNNKCAHPFHWDNRSFSTAEFKRIMSIPDDYILTGSYRKQWERIGRMVPPFMMKAIAENILTLGVL